MYRTYLIGTAPSLGRWIYAPSLLDAFDLARRHFGSATLHCYGSAR